jgi:hypothetical protein
VADEGFEFPAEGVALDPVGEGERDQHFLVVYVDE